MSLRKTSLISTAVTMAAMLVILFLALYLILMQSFLALESNNVKENVDRVVNALTHELDNLNSTAADWAYWDDTYSFVQGTNDGYIETNISYDTVANLGLNLMTFLNADGQVVLAEGVDLRAEQEVPVSEGLKSAIVGNKLLLDHSELEGSVTGLLQTPDDPLLLASRAILTSKNQGPSAGTLVIGRYLDDSELGALSQSLRLDIHLHTLDETPGKNLLERISNSTATLVEPRDSDIVDGYTLVNDISGQPALVLHIEMPRLIYAQAQTTLNYVFLALIGIGVVFELSTAIQLNRIMSRLSWLSGVMTRIRQTGDTTIDVTVEGYDEVANLGRGLQEMLDALARSRGELQRANDSLEKLVEHRTAALAETNIALRREIAERKQAQSELAQARDQALEALRLKTQILANISHDARTPLSVILLRTRMLQAGRYGSITETQDEKLESIAFNVQELTNFINNLLDGAQMEIAKVRLAYEDVAPAELLANLDETARPLADRKGVILTWEVADDLPDSVHTDPARFRQILSNLVGNAIKFTREGFVRVRLYPPDADHWALEVADTGPGIPADAQERIFEAFWQVDGSMTREADRGVGLGLSIVRQSAILMHGDVTVQSEPGVGTTFIVTFPYGGKERGRLEHAQPVSADR